jgi:hypothetical protein
VGWSLDHLGTTRLEWYVRLIHEGDTPENSGAAATLYHFVNRFQEEKENDRT